MTDNSFDHEWVMLRFLDEDLYTLIEHDVAVVGWRIVLKRIKELDREHNIPNIRRHLVTHLRAAIRSQRMIWASIIADIEKDMKVNTFPDVRLEVFFDKANAIFDDPLFAIADFKLVNLIKDKGVSFNIGIDMLLSRLLNSNIEICYIVMKFAVAFKLIATWMLQDVRWDMVLKRIRNFIGE